MEGEVNKGKSYFLKIIKIIMALLSSILIIIILIGVIIRQPSFKTIDYKYKIKSDPQKLKEHVEFLSLKAPPRNHRYEKGLEETRNYINEH
ncbi:MAG: hypothetical protein N2445_07560, partial [Acidobacteria bacterium]|nr:hypothetical protein [Acidobacteriota bacterium]